MSLAQSPDAAPVSSRLCVRFCRRVNVFPLARSSPRLRARTDSKEYLMDLFGTCDPECTLAKNPNRAIKALPS